MFGAANALFSGLAFAGVIVAILLQRNELELQREELALTRHELARTAVAQDRSQQALNDQAALLAISTRLASLQTLIQIEQLELSKHQTHTTLYKRAKARLDTLHSRTEVLANQLNEFSAEHRTDGSQGSSLAPIE
jgi:hypothetical protein